jgi:hypothetical protein
MSHTELHDWEANNVDLWINNDEELYCDAYGKVTMIGPKEAAKEMWRMLKGKKTPDGARYTYNRIYETLARMEV